MVWVWVEMRNWCKGLIIFGVLIVVLIVLWGFDFNLTGNVVWSPESNVSDCDNIEIKLIWEEIFVESYDSISVIDSSDVNGCERVAVKIKNNQVWIIYVANDGDSFYDWESDVLYRSLNKSIFWAVYFNATFNVFEEYGMPTEVSDVDELLGIRGSVGLNLTNWTLFTKEDANTEFLKYIKASGLNFEDNYDGFKADDESFSNLIFIKNRLEMPKNKSTISFEVNKYYFEEIDAPVYKKNISNFVFEMNTSWNTAFNTSEYMDDRDGLYVSALPFPYGGDDAVHIPTRTENGLVQFEARNEINGSSSFILKGEIGGGGISSNVFNVTIVEEINDAPELFKNIEDLFVPRNGGLNVYLDTFFTDNEGDMLIYRVSGDEDLNINFNGGNMTIRLGENYNKPVAIYIYASDGMSEIKSNRVDVYE